MNEPRCAVSPRRSEREIAGKRLEAVSKIRLRDFDPEEGYEWPMPEESRDTDGDGGGGAHS
jgi:hypothetical protein